MATSHSFSVLSLPDSTVRPSGENATESTKPESKLRSRRHDAASQSLRVLSSLTDNMVRPSGENAASPTNSVCSGAGMAMREGGAIGACAELASGRRNIAVTADASASMVEDASAMFASLDGRWLP